jgi:cob(I)alamin adenosyltransferase
MLMRIFVFCFVFAGEEPKEHKPQKRTQDDIDKLAKEIEELKAAHQKRLKSSSS